MMPHIGNREPIASMPTDQVVATYAPVIQHYLTGDVP